MRKIGLGALDGRKLARMWSSADVVRLLDPHAPPPDPGTGWALAADEDLRPALIRRLREDLPEAWSRALYQTIVLDTAAGVERVAAALAVVAGVAGRMVPQDERAIFKRCIALLDRPPDPYSRTAGQLTAAARHAAAEVLAHDPSLDHEAGEALAAGRAPLMRAVVASALRASAQDDDARRFLDYVRRLNLAPEELVRLAEDCGSDRSAADAVLVEHQRLPSWLERTRARALAPSRALVAYLLGPGLAAVLAVVGSHVSGRLTTVSVDTSVGVGALAVLAAVHVLSVQLATVQLPSPIAATAVAPTEIKAAYGLGVALLVVTLLDGLKPAPKWHPGAVAAVLLVIFVVLLVAATIRVVRNLGGASASSVAARRSRPLALRAGRDVAGLRRQERSVREAIDRYEHLRSEISPDESVRRQPLRAEQAGFLEVRAEDLAELSDKSGWRDGELRVDIIAMPGAGLAPGSEYASIIPADRVAVSATDYKSVSRAFRVERHRRLERLAELCAALVGQMVAVADSGDIAGARRVQAELLALLRGHLVVARQDDPSGASPPSPALIAGINRSLAALARSGDEDVRELCIGLLRGLLPMAGPGDPLLVLTSSRAVPSGPATLSQLSVLYDAGHRAVELGSDSDVSIVQRALHRLVAGNAQAARYANETAARLVQYAAIADPLHSRRAWQRYREAAVDTPSVDRVFNFARIGAAALRAGNLALAVEVAHALPAGVDLEDLRRQIHDPDRAGHENFLSGLFGRLLGTDAETRLDRFIDAALAFRSNLPAPAPTGEVALGEGHGA